MLRLIRCVAAIALLGGLRVGWAGQAPGDDDRLDVSRVWSDAGGRIISQKAVDGRNVLHGVQLSVADHGWLKEIAVYNSGRLEQRTLFYQDLQVFLEQRREHNGDGSEVVYGPRPGQIIADKVVAADQKNIGPIRMPEVICQGQVKGDRRWSGSFLEAVREGFARTWMLREYRDGKVVKSDVFPIDRLGLPKELSDVERWPWQIPDWPISQTTSSGDAARRPAEH